MAATGAQNNVSQVDIASLREVASQGRQNVSALRSLLDQMEREINSSDSFWEGDAAELYRSVFRREMGEMRQAFESFAAYTNELEEQANTFEGVHTTAQQIASEVQVTIWAEV